MSLHQAFCKDLKVLLPPRDGQLIDDDGFIQSTMHIPTVNLEAKITKTAHAPHSFLSGLLRTDFAEVRRYYLDPTYF
jgi:hypothetical protein